MDNAGNPFEGGLNNDDIVKVSGPGDHLKCANRDGGYDDTVDGSSARKYPIEQVSGLELTESHSDCDDSWSSRRFHYRISHDTCHGTTTPVREGSRQDAGRTRCCVLQL